jgi:hypothetical protein
MQPCQMCGLPSKLVKAHIIPEAFFRAFRPDGESLTLLTSTPGNFPKRAPIGVYDSEILCEPCERRFDQVDDYGIQVLLTQFHDNFTEVAASGAPVAHQSMNVNQGQILRFLLAVLWRASVSKHPFFGRVSLGPLESIARNTLMNPEGEIPQVFAALLSRWTCTDENRSIAQAVMCPFRERWQGVNAYRLYLGEVVAYVKVDSQPFTPPLRAHALPTSPVLSLIIRNLEDSKDLKSMIHTVRRSDANVELMRAKIARSRSARAKNAP